MTCIGCIRTGRDVVDENGKVIARKCDACWAAIEAECMQIAALRDELVAGGMTPQIVGRIMEAASRITVVTAGGSRA